MHYQRHLQRQVTTREAAVGLVDYRDGREDEYYEALYGDEWFDDAEPMNDWINWREWNEGRPFRPTFVVTVGTFSGIAPEERSAMIPDDDWFDEGFVNHDLLDYEPEDDYPFDDPLFI